MTTSQKEELFANPSFSEEENAVASEVIFCLLTEILENEKNDDNAVGFQKRCSTNDDTAGRGRLRLISEAVLSSVFLSELLLYTS